MEDLPYHTTEIMYLKLSDVHDLASYYELMRLAWVNYSSHILIGICIGLICGVVVTKTIFNSEVLNKWIQKQKWISKP